MDQADVFRRVIEFLDLHGVSYAIVGSVAAMSYGESRMTVDMDVLAAISEQHLPALLSAFSSPEWYVSEVAAREAIRRRTQFNIIHPESGNKVDVMIGKSQQDEVTLQRALRRPIESGLIGSVAHPNDIILGKLRYYAEGGSQKHLTDITAMVRISSQFIDVDELTQRAVHLGVLPIWESILEEVRNTPPPPADFSH